MESLRALTFSFTVFKNKLAGYSNLLCLLFLGLFFISFCSGTWTFYNQRSYRNDLHQVVIPGLSLKKAQKYRRLFLTSPQVDSIELETVDKKVRFSVDGKSHEAWLRGVSFTRLKSRDGGGEDRIPSLIDNDFVNPVVFVNHHLQDLLTYPIREGDTLELREQTSGNTHLAVKSIFKDYSTNRAKATIALSYFNELFGENTPISVTFSGHNQGHAEALFKLLQKWEGRKVELIVPSELKLQYHVKKTLIALVVLGFILLVSSFLSIIKRHKSEVKRYWPFLKVAQAQGRSKGFFLLGPLGELTLIVVPISFLAILAGTVFSLLIIKEIFPLIQTNHAGGVLTQLGIMLYFAISLPFLIHSYHKQIKPLFLRELEGQG